MKRRRGIVSGTQRRHDEGVSGQSFAMRRATTPSLHSERRNSAKLIYSIANAAPIICIQNGTFYRQHPSSQATHSNNQPMFPNLTFSLPSYSSNAKVQQQHWAIIGPSSSGKTTLLEILRGKHVCIPPRARPFPYLSHTRGAFNPGRAIGYVGFTDQGPGSIGTGGAYLSARYESRRENTDFSVLKYLRGDTELNPADTRGEKNNDERLLERSIKELGLEDLVDMPVGNLSNGQMRRARIAKALLRNPEVLLLDEPFMGLDPYALHKIDELLRRLAQAQDPHLIMALRPQDRIPDWISHLVILEPGLRVKTQGEKDAVRLALEMDIGSTTYGENAEGLHSANLKTIDETKQESLVVMEDVNIKYGSKQILGGWKDTRSGLWWTIRRGERWGVFGPNGSGKTTLLSLITSDHPASYTPQIQIFNQPRLPTPGKPGVSIFDIQSRIGHSSPEIHRFFPKRLTLRQTIKSAWADTFLGTPRLGPKDERVVEKALQWFEPELNPAVSTTDDLFPKEDTHRKHQSTAWADATRFSDIPFSSQRLTLFIRAVIKKPDLVILDEAFGGMDEKLLVKCKLFLTWGTNQHRPPHHSRRETTTDKGGDLILGGLEDRQALVVVSHVKEEVPGIVQKWIKLPEPGSGKAPVLGSFSFPLDMTPWIWERIWQE